MRVVDVPVMRMHCACAASRPGVSLNSLNYNSHPTRSIGRYTLTPLTHKTDCGRFQAALSIRSGRGTTTHDRVYRFIPLFATSRDAARYGLEQGLEYAQRQQPATA
ncbi:hypothetical protein GALL_399210 [mine drainage metagenome]|uniref:Uncharacterized protein n=1 Tax=mine drainage metagenome TaxID=410659 RepID=A0A1J5Q3W9_9ZZZZ